MGLVTPAKEYIYVEQVDHNSPLSEDLFKKIGASINWINQNHTDQLGDVITSILTEAQFQSIRSDKWVMMIGQDISGSDLATLTSINTLPNLVGGGVPVNAGNANLGNLTSGDNKTHRHQLWDYDKYGSNSVHGFASATTEIKSSSATTLYTLRDTDEGNGHVLMANQGGTNNLAAGVSTNFFIKINN